MTFEGAWPGDHFADAFSKVVSRELDAGAKRLGELFRPQSGDSVQCVADVSMIEACYNLSRHVEANQ